MGNNRYLRWKKRVKKVKDQSAYEHFETRIETLTLIVANINLMIDELITQVKILTPKIQSINSNFLSKTTKHYIEAIDVDDNNITKAELKLLRLGKLASYLNTKAIAIDDIKDIDNIFKLLVVIPNSYNDQQKNSMSLDKFFQVAIMYYYLCLLFTIRIT